VKNFMVANVNVKSPRYSLERIEILLGAQIDNSLELGWNIEDIILLTNFDYEFMGVKAINIPFNEFCWTGSKMFGLKWFFENNKIDDIIWAHDLDCWQNIKFECPEIGQDVGASYYSNPKFNGGSVFWKSSSKDIIDEIVNRITENKEEKEEPILNKVFKSKEFRDRVSILNRTYNVGCSGFIPRFNNSLKPIHVCHFHPYNGIAWEMHALDREELGEIAVTIRLERLLRKYYKHLAVQLNPKKKKKKKKI